MKKLFAILPLLGSVGFFWGAYLFFITARQVSPWAYFGVGLFALCGLGFLFWGLGWLLQTKNESVAYKDGQALKTSGTKITASIAHLQQITNIKINGRSPYVIHAKGVNPATGKEQVFKSFWLWSDPLAQAGAGRGIDIYLDRNNAKKYYLDVESIGLPAEQARVNKIVSLAVIIPIVILIVAGIIIIVAYQKNKKYIDLMNNAWSQAKQQNWSNQDDPSAKCMKKLYGEDVFEKLQQGKFVPPADISQKMQECERNK